MEMAAGMAPKRVLLPQLAIKARQRLARLGQMMLQLFGRHYNFHNRLDPVAFLSAMDIDLYHMLSTTGVEVSGLYNRYLTRRGYVGLKNSKINKTRQR